MTNEALQKDISSILCIGVKCRIGEWNIQTLTEIAKPIFLEKQMMFKAASGNHLHLHWSGFGSFLDMVVWLEDQRILKHVYRRCFCMAGDRMVLKLWWHSKIASDGKKLNIQPDYLKDIASNGSRWCSVCKEAISLRDLPQWWSSFGLSNHR